MIGLHVHRCVGGRVGCWCGFCRRVIGGAGWIPIGGNGYWCVTWCQWVMVTGGPVRWMMQSGMLWTASDRYDSDETRLFWCRGGAPQQLAERNSSPSVTDRPAPLPGWQAFPQFVGRRSFPAPSEQPGVTGFRPEMGFGIWKYLLGGQTNASRWHGKTRCEEAWILMTVRRPIGSQTSFESTRRGRGPQDFHVKILQRTFYRSESPQADALMHQGFNQHGGICGRR